MILWIIGWKKVFLLKLLKVLVKFIMKFLLITKLLQTKPNVWNENILYYDSYYTVNKNRDGKGVVDLQYGNDFIDFTDFIPNHYVGGKK